MFGPAERRSLHALPAASTVRVCRLGLFFFQQFPQTLSGGSSRNAVRLFAFLKAMAAKQTPLSCPPPTLGVFVFSLEGHAAAEVALSEHM